MFVTREESQNMKLNCMVTYHTSRVGGGITNFQHNDNCDCPQCVLTAKINYVLGAKKIKYDLGAVVFLHPIFPSKVYRTSMLCQNILLRV